MNHSELMDFLREIEACLLRLKPVHDRLFGFSLGKLLPFLQPDEPTIPASDLEALRSVQTRLAACQEMLATRLTHLSLTDREMLNNHLTGLTAAAEHLYRIAERQNQKPVAPGSYTAEQYQADVHLYEAARTRYRRIGPDVFEIARKSMLAQDEAGSAGPVSDR